MATGQSYDWLMRHFHPDGLKCVHCGAAWSQAREFRVTKESQLPDYRCRACGKTYNVYSGTVFEGRQVTVEQAVLLVRGVIKGEQAQVLTNETGVCRQTVQTLRRLIQANALSQQPESALADVETETDEMFQNAGEKRRVARQPERPSTAARQ